MGMAIGTLIDNMIEYMIDRAKSDTISLSHEHARFCTLHLWDGFSESVDDVYQECITHFGEPIEKGETEEELIEIRIKLGSVTHIVRRSADSGTTRIYP